MARLVCGVGINDLGLSSDLRYHTRDEARHYEVWHQMLNRCYNSKSNKSYNGCTVYEPWKTLSIFINDMKSIPGYKDWRKNPGKWSLDKDILVPGNREYVPGKVQFVDCRVNSREAVQRTRTYKSAQEACKKAVRGIDPSGVEHIYSSTQEAADDNGWSRECVKNAIHRGNKTHGWTFTQI